MFWSCHLVKYYNCQYRVLISRKQARHSNLCSRIPNPECGVKKNKFVQLDKPGWLFFDLVLVQVIGLFGLVKYFLQGVYVQSILTQTQNLFIIRIFLRFYQKPIVFTISLMTNF